MVTDDVAAHALVMGNPARVVGWVCRCGTRVEPPTGCAGCGVRYAVDVDGGIEVIAG